MSPETPETPKQRPPRRDEPSEPSLASPRSRARQADAGTPALAGAAGGSGSRGRRPFPLSGTKRFLEESVAELKKVEWPKQNQVIQGTGVVLFACLVVGVFLYVSDQAFKHLVENVFLGQ